MRPIIEQADIHLQRLVGHGVRLRGLNDTMFGPQATDVGDKPHPGPAYSLMSELSEISSRMSKALDILGQELERLEDGLYLNQAKPAATGLDYSMGGAKPSAFDRGGLR